MTPATRRTENCNGVELYFELHGSGAPLLLLHGFSGSSQDWSALVPDWAAHFQLIIPDLRCHGRSNSPSATFRFSDAASDILALLERLGVNQFKALGISGGGNTLLHLATREPDRVAAMVLVSATSYYPSQARAIMRQYPDRITDAEREVLRRRHPGGDAQIGALLAHTRAFADSFDDMNFTPPYLSTITARTLIVQGDRDPLYPVEISVEMARSIPCSSLWIVPGGGHGPVGGEHWPEFVKTAFAFLCE
jgi:pimeloyl-ACP methyl ester carboxylesterase